MATILRKSFANLMGTSFTRGKNSNGIVGSGLGLTIVQDVVNAHNGKLKLSNHETGGACAILSF